MRAALLSAPYDTAIYRIGENLGIRYLAAYLQRDGIHVDVIEPSLEGLDGEQLRSRIAAGAYEVVGVSIMFDVALEAVADLIAGLRADGVSAHITVGGHVASFRHEELLDLMPGLDSVVRFEGEAAFRELVERLRTAGRWQEIPGIAHRTPGGVVANPPGPLIADLDTLPFPSRNGSSLHLGDRHFFVVTTRGCPYQCTFCSVPSFYRSAPGPSWRARSVDDVMAELAYLRGSWGAVSISFLDDEFLAGPGGKRRALGLADRLVESGLGLTWSFECRADDVDGDLFRQLSAAGLRHVFLGLESGSQDVLDLFRKRTTVEVNRAAVAMIRSLGLGLSVGFILFHPDATPGQIVDSLRFLRDTGLGSYRTVSGRLVAYRGTPLERRLAAEGRMVGPIGYRFDDPNLEDVHQLFSEHLRPFDEIDVACRRMQFALDNLSPGAVPEGAVERLAMLRSRLSDSVVDIALMALTWVTDEGRRAVEVADLVVDRTTGVVPDLLGECVAACATLDCVPASLKAGGR